MPDQRTRIAIVAVGAIALVASGIGYFSATHSQPPPIAISGPPSDPPPPISPEPSSAASNPTAPSVPVTTTTAPPSAQPVSNISTAQLAVDVSGAVNQPTVYYLPPGSRVQQAIHAAGGPTSDADLDQVNLAEKLTDGEKVFIPSKSGSGGTVSSGNTIGETGSTSEDSGSSGMGHGLGSGKFMSPADGQVDLNTATAEDLQRVPGIGPAMAGRILAYRQEVGSFHSVDDLRQVTGVGDKKLAKWSPYFVVH